MSFYRLFITAIRSLDAHFFRSLLTTVSVIIGVASVVACMALLEGTFNDILRRFKSMGSNAVYVIPESAHVGGRNVGQAQTLTLEDGQRLLRELPDQVESVAPEAIGMATVKRLQFSGDYTVVATSDEFFGMNNYKAAQGRVLNRSESDDEYATVVILGHKVAEDLFGGSEAVGQSVKVGSTSYRVLGVMEKHGSIGFLNSDDAVYLPIKAALKRFFNRKYLSRLTVAASDPEKIAELQKQVIRVLRDAHRIKPGEESDFTVFNQEETLQNVNIALMIFKIVFYSIAGISLLVGGIGIMNIMLVSVTERTREIGVRMAVGARRLDILMQFLIEAATISLIGGALGLLLGSMLADIADKAMRNFDWKTEINALIVLVALGASVVVGVFSGLYPAFKASRLDPVDALRYE